MMRHAKIPLKDILTDGPDAGRFSFSFEPDIAGLADSIRNVGLVNPPTLRSRDGRFEVVCGFKRVLACDSLGFSAVDAIAYDADELSEEKCLWFSLIENAHSGGLSPVECAIALRKFSAVGYDAARLAREVAPNLGLPASERYIENHLELLSLDKDILSALHDGSFGVEQALCLRQSEPESRAALFHVLSSCRANLNETRELVSLIPDVAAMKGMSVSDFIAGEITPIVADDALSPRKRLQRLRERLVRLRYPRLTEAESAFEAAVEKMNLGEQCRVTAPKHFEGDEITLTIRARSADYLKGVVAKLNSAEVERGFEKLFSILRGEKA